MHWVSLGQSWELRFREIEHFVRRHSRTRPSAPNDELPDGEQRAALRREAARRLVVERG